MPDSTRSLFALNPDIPHKEICLNEKAQESNYVRVDPPMDHNTNQDARV